MLSDDRILHRLAIVQVVLSSLILCVGVVLIIVAMNMVPRVANLEQENRDLRQKIDKAIEARDRALAQERHSRETMERLNNLDHEYFRKAFADAGINVE